MLKIEREGDKQFVIRIDGEVTSEDMERELDKLLDESADLEGGRLLYDIRNFQFPGISAIMVKITRLPQLFALIRRFDKAAVMTETAWISKIAEWENHLMPGWQIKTFTHDDEKTARQWLEA